MAVAESFVRSRLGPYEARIRSVIDDAWRDYLSIDVRHKFMFPRTRANIVFDLIAGRMIAEFDGDKAIRIIQKDETVKVLVEDVLLLRIKKAANDGLGQNIQTQAVMEFVAQGPEIPGLLPDIYKIELCYFESKTGAEIDSVRVTARDNDDILWWYELGRKASGTVIEFPAPSGGDAPPDLAPRKIDKEKKPEDKG